MSVSEFIADFYRNRLFRQHFPTAVSDLFAGTCRQLDNVKEKNVSLQSTLTLYVMISFNKPYLCGDEKRCIDQALDGGKLCGDGPFTHRCQQFFETKFPGSKCLLTTSCTDALEMCALLAGIGPGDEVIVPSYTFVSSALVFTRQGARVVFAESRADQPDVDAASLEKLITPRTRAIVVMHYAGVACDMDPVMELAARRSLIVIEDAAQAVDSYYKGRPLGTIGHMAAFSFHETKNIQCGEGGLLVVNDPHYVQRAEILREKGTNRAQFFRGEIDKYGWVDTGSSFLPNDYTAAFLWAQLNCMERIQTRRKALWQRYYTDLQELAARREGVRLPFIPDYATCNGHAFYLVCGSLDERTRLIAHLMVNGVQAVFHYLSLHKSAYIRDHEPDQPDLPQADRYTDCLVRLPLYYELPDEEADRIAALILEFYRR